MNCPRCRTLVLAEDVNLEHLLAKCRHCQEVFRFAENEVEAITDRVRASERLAAKPGTHRAPRPGTILVDDLGRDRRIVKRWFELRYLFMALFCVVWDGFLFSWYWMAMTHEAPWLAIIFPVLHVTCGVCLTYATLAGFLNSTVITLSDSTVEVRHGPIPWLGSVTLPIAAIMQLYCIQIESIQWMMPGRDYWGVAPVKLSALLRDGRQEPLLRRVPRDEGLFIEQQLEEWLEIEPEHVPGQVD